VARTPLVVGNWKLHNSVSESLALATEIKNQLFNVRKVEVAVAPVFTALHPVGRRLEGTALGLAAQDCFWEDKGAWTGAVSTALLRDVGCAYVIVGHSERRQHFGELDAAVNLKAKAVLRHGMAPIICIGETEAERDAGETFGRLTAQLDGALDGIDTKDAARVVVAYEPVWAIGTGRTASVSQVDEAHHFIRTRLVERWGEAAEEVRIQYGGSVKPQNAQQLMSCMDVDGALVGGASLNAESFVAIVRCAM
jgi:triosephosphate isomerase